MSKPVPESNKQVISYLNVKAEVAKNSNYTSNIKYRGRISSYENVSLSAEVSGKIIPKSKSSYLLPIKSYYFSVLAK